MAKTFSFDLDMNKGERSDQIVYGRAGDKQSVNIVANLKLDGATWTPPSGDVNAYFECITGDNKSIRVKATLSGSTVSVSLPTDVYSFFGIVSNAYFRVEVGSADSPTYVESSASFSVYIFGSVDTAYTAFENSADLVNWRKLNATLNEVINQANASVNAAIKAFNEQLSDNKSRIDQAVSGASQVVDEADSLRRGGLAKPLSVSDGGTGADNAAQARANLGISGSAFSGDYNDLTNKPSLFSGNYNDLTNKPAIPATPISVANGGTGATTAAQARANLGIAKLSSDITSAYNAADSAIETAYKAADKEIETAYKAADSALAARFPIKSADIADGAITESKLSADLLKPSNSGISASDNLKVLYVGDSYGVPTSYNTQTPIPMAIQNITNWTITNDSRGGRGYINKDHGGETNRNFEETINSYSGEYDLIIIAGGRNDSGYSIDGSSAEYTAALKCFNTAHSKFQNAKIVAVPMLWHDTGLNCSASNAYVGIVSAAKNTIGTYCVEGAQSWGLDFTNWQEGGIHPDTSIAESYARHIVNAICTNFDGWVSYNKHVIIGGGSDCDLFLAYSHGIYTVNGTIKGTYELKKPNMPHWFSPQVNGYSFTASVLSTGAYNAVFIDQNQISVFGTPADSAIVNWNSSPFGSVE